MKHHGGVVKTPRQAAPRPPRVASSASAAPTLTPTTGSPVSFWNQYQAFLTNSSDPKEEAAPGPANGSQGEDAEMPRLAESPNKPKSREDLQIVSEENRNESVRGTEPEGMWCPWERLWIREIWCYFHCFLFLLTGLVGPIVRCCRSKPTS